MQDRMDSMHKQRLNIILLVDTSTSMRGERIREVNSAIEDIISYLRGYSAENSYASFYLSIITFATDSGFALKDKAEEISNVDFKPIKCGGYSNLHLGYQSLSTLLTKESNGGIMPDFGGIAPIILLLTDGHPTKYPLNDELEALRKLPWYKVALRYGIAIELKDKRTIGVLRDFVEGNGDVIECYDSNLLKKIIKVIVVSASKVKSSGNSVHNSKRVSVNKQIQLEVSEALTEVDDWEW